MGEIWGEYGASFEIKIKMQVKCKSAFRKNVDVSTIFTYTEAGSSPATRTTSEQSKLCSVFLCMKNIRLLTADVFIPFRERLYFIHRNIAIRNDNIIFL